MAERGATMRELPIHRGEPGLYIEPATGQPLWPVDSDEVLAELTSLCGARGVQLVSKPGRSGRTTGSEGAVIALGDHAREAAELYGHLTRRRYLHARDVSELPALWGPDVVITTPDQVSAELLHVMYGRGGQSWAPGLIYAPRERLYREALLTSAAAAAEGCYERSHLELYPHLDVPSTHSEAGTILTANVDSDAIREALGAPVEVLSLFSHSDGIDAPLSEDLVMCSLLALSRPGQDGQHVPGGPYCQVSGQCFRYELPVEEVLASSLVASVEGLEGRICLLVVCRGLLVEGSSIDRRWSLIDRMARSRWGAIVTSYGLILLNVPTFLDILAQVYERVPVGQVVARYNAMPVEGKLCLIGDPCVRPSETSYLPTGASHPVMSLLEDEDEEEDEEDGDAMAAVIPTGEFDVEQAGSADDHVRFLEFWLSQQHEQAETERLRALAARALDIARGYDGSRDAAAALAAALFELRDGDRRMFVHSWLHLRQRVHVLDGQRCGNCQAVCDVSRSGFADPRIPERRLQFCPRCGIVEDAPLANEICLRQDPSGGFELCGELPETGAEALITVGGRGHSISFPWPRSGQRLARQFMPPRPWPRGPIDIQVYLFRDGQLSVFGLMTREDAPPTEPVASQAGPA